MVAGVQHFGVEGQEPRKHVGSRLGNAVGENRWFGKEEPRASAESGYDSREFARHPYARSIGRRGETFVIVAQVISRTLL